MIARFSLFVRLRSRCITPSFEERPTHRTQYMHQFIVYWQFYHCIFIPLSDVNAIEWYGRIWSYHILWVLCVCARWDIRFICYNEIIYNFSVIICYCYRRWWRMMMRCFVCVHNMRITVSAALRMDRSIYWPIRNRTPMRFNHNLFVKLL